MSPSPSRDEHGRLKSNFAKAHIPRAVAEVCTYVDAADPQSVTRTRFDASREKAGWENLPKAKSLAARMEMTWEELKDLALNGDREVARRHSTTRERPQGAFSVEQVPFALRVVHARLARKAGKDRSEVPMSGLAYDQEIATMWAETDHLPVGQRMILPDSSMIERLTDGTFDQACAAAGISYGAVVVHGMERIDAIEMCLDAHGVLPTEHQLKAFAKANEIAMRTPTRKHTLDIAALRARRDEQGLETPRGYAKARERPDFTERVIDGDGVVRRRRDRAEVTPEALLVEAGEFLDWLESPRSPRGALPTIAMWDLWADSLAEQGERRSTISMITRKYETGFTGLISDAYDARLPEDLRETSASDAHLVPRNGPVRGDEKFDYDRPLVDYLRGYRTRLFLPILAYVHQHHPAARVEIGEATKMSSVSRVKSINRLVNMGALVEVAALPGDEHHNIRERLVLGPAVTGEALHIVEAQPPIEKAQPRRAPLPQQWRDDANRRALALAARLADRDGVFYGSDFTEHAGMSRTAVYQRLNALVDGGLVAREELAPEDKRTNERYRFHLLPAGRKAAAAAEAADEAA